MAILLCVSLLFLRVLGADAAPLPDATVSYFDGQNTVAVRTDARGVASVPNGFFPVGAMVSAPGFVTASVPIAASAHVCGFDVTLQTATRLIGVVRVATGSPEQLHALPVAAAVLGPTTIARLPQLASDGLLRALPGADYTRSNSPFTNFGQLRASFDGAGQNRGLVRADGLPAQDGFGGQVDWAAYPPFDLAGVELLRGAGSALYGSGAVGGVLDVETFAPPARGVAPSGMISVASGTHGMNEAAMRWRGAIGDKVSAALFARDWRASYFDFPPNFRSGVDFPAAQSSVSAEQLRLRVDGGASWWEFGSLFSADQQQQGRPNYWMTRRLAQFSGRYSVTSPQSLVEVGAYGRDGFITNAADRFPAAPGVALYVQHLPTVEGGASFAWTVLNAGGEFSARAEQRTVRGANDQFLPNGVLQNSGSGAQWLGGVALQQVVRRPRFELLAGARLDQVTAYYLTMVRPGASPGTYVTTHPPDVAGSAISPRAAVRYDLSPALALRASSGAGFRAPYLNELVRGFVIGGVTFAPNPALVPERSHTYGGGVDALGGRMHASLDVSTTKVRDAIAFVTLSPTLRKRANVSETQTDGVTLSYTEAIGACAALRASATTQYARVTAGPAAIVGKRLAFVPDQAADVGLDADIAKVRLGVDLAYLGQTYADDLNTQPLGTALVGGFSVAAPVSRDVVLTLTGANVTNRTYLSSQDRLAPPAIFTLGLSAPLGHTTPRSCGS